MSSIFQATAVLGVAFLPGALFVWAFERLAGQFGIQRKDRVLRFVGGSAVFLALFSTPLYWLYSNYWQAFAEVHGRRSVVARYPEPQDLYLAATIDVDPRTGELRGDWHTATDDDIGILLRWEDVEYLEFIHAEERTATDVEDDQEGIGMAVRSRRSESRESLRGHRRHDADK